MVGHMWECGTEHEGRDKFKFDFRTELFISSISVFVTTIKAPSATDTDRAIASCTSNNKNTFSTASSWNRENMVLSDIIGPPSSSFSSSHYRDEGKEPAGEREGREIPRTGHHHHLCTHL
jgi:hypothetical protein